MSAKRRDIPRPYNGGEWTESRFRYFIKGALRKAQWPQKYAAIKEAFVKHGINPETGRKCKLHRCEECRGLFPQNGVQADHIVPVVGAEGFVSWDDYIKRLFCEKDGFRVLCKSCHKRVTDLENKGRMLHKAVDGL